MRKALFLMAFVFSGVTVLKAQEEVVVKSAFDSTRIFIGDQINFTVTIEKPERAPLALPSFRDTIIKNIEILKGPSIDSIAAGKGRIRIIEKYLVTSFDSGYYEVNPVYAEAKTAEGIRRYFSDYARLEVMKYRIAPADSAAKIYDIAGPYKAPLTFGDIFPWVLLAIIVLISAFLLVRYLKKRRENKPLTEVIINPDPAHVIAFRELDKLKGEELWQKGQLKYYYTRLTEILRQYLENRYAVYSLELTTSETLHELVRTGFRRDSSYDLLKSVLTAADLVKFAKYIPGNEEHVKYFDDSWRFVEATRLEEQPLQMTENGRKEGGK